MSRKKDLIEVINIRISSIQKNAIVHCANACGLTLSDYCRQVLLNNKPRKKFTEDELLLLSEVRKIAADLQHLNNFFHSKNWDNVKNENTKIINKLKYLLYDCNQ